MVDPHVAVPVGVAGFHGGPDKVGMVRSGIGSTLTGVDGAMHGDPSNRCSTWRTATRT